MRSECYFCHQKTVQSLVHKFKPDEVRAQEFIYAIHHLLEEHKMTPNPQLATYIHRVAKEKLDVGDLYAEEKEAANRALLNDYKYWQDFIHNSSDPFATAAKLAVVGNIIDYGAHSLSGDLLSQIRDLYTKDLRINKVDELKQALLKAEKVLYLGDNAGEIFFDRLFIEQINHPNLSFVTRGAPVINDVTLVDAQRVGMDKRCKVIDNGMDAPSTLLTWCSDDFKDAYESADVIISKGQGNFEGLMDEKHPSTFFMLIAKCRPIAELLGVDKGDMLIHRLC